MIKYATAVEAEDIIDQCVLELVNERKFYDAAERVRDEHQFDTFLNLVCGFIKPIMARDRLLADRSELGRISEGTFVTALRRRVAVDAWRYYDLPRTTSFDDCVEQIRRMQSREPSTCPKPEPVKAETMQDYQDRYQEVYTKVRRQVKRYETWKYFSQRVDDELAGLPKPVTDGINVAFLKVQLWEAVDGNRHNSDYQAVRRTVFVTPTPSQPETTKEPIMANASTPFEVITFVYGSDVKSMSEEQLIDSIKRAEADIAKLNVVKTVSKKLEAKKAELQTAIDKMVEALDAK